MQNTHKGQTVGVHRVSTYKRTIINPQTGLESTELCTFSQTQANEVGAVLETDGIGIKDCPDHLGFSSTPRF